MYKSADSRGSPFPGQSHPTGFVTGMPGAVQRPSTATRTWISATWRAKPLATRPCPSRFTMHLGLYAASAAVSAPTSPDGSAQASRGTACLVPGDGSCACGRSVPLPPRIRYLCCRPAGLAGRGRQTISGSNRIDNDPRRFGAVSYEDRFPVFVRRGGPTTYASRLSHWIPEVNPGRDLRNKADLILVAICFGPRPAHGQNQMPRNHLVFRQSQPGRRFS